MERRGFYRVQPTDSEPLSVQVGVDGRVVDAELIDISAGGVGLRVQQELTVALGDRVAITLGTPELSLSMEAVVVSSMDLTDGHRLGAQFIEAVDTTVDLPPFLRELLNRRRAVRVAPKALVEVYVRPMDDHSDIVVGTLIDISTTGLSLWLDAQPSSGVGEEVLLTFELEADSPLDVVAAVRSVSDGEGPRVRCTVEFMPEETVGFDAQARQLANYVGDRVKALVHGSEGQGSRGD